MDIKTLILFCITYFTVQVQCLDNLGRFFQCWPYKIFFETFDVKFYHSSRWQVNQLIPNDPLFGPGGIDFDPRRKTAVLIHGFVGLTKETRMDNLRDELLKLQDMNVIVVRWEKGANNPITYHIAAANTEYAAFKIKSFFAWLKNSWSKYSKENWGPIHFIGFSLGAHVAGQAAERLKVEENLIIDRITALDPAEPCFETTDQPLRISKTNAKFVDVIHTDGAQKMNSAFGIFEPIGHVDFYVNGGIGKQPGCGRTKRTPAIGDVIKKIFKVADHVLNHGSCSHSRAVDVFIQSIANANSLDCRFWGHPWQLETSEQDTGEILNNNCHATFCPEMGIHAEKFQYRNEQSNIYYVRTTAVTPFCIPV